MNLGARCFPAEIAVARRPRRIKASCGSCISATTSVAQAAGKQLPVWCQRQRQRELASLPGAGKTAYCCRVAFTLHRAMPDIERWPRHSQAERLNIANSNRMVGPCPSRYHHRSYSEWALTYPVL